MLKRLLGIKKINRNNKTKQYFLWIPFFKKKWNEHNIKMYICGVQYLQIKQINENIKIYLFGIQVLSYKNFKIPNNFEKSSAVLNLKALELLNERKVFHYEKERI